ncbi:MAG: LysR family transcriptional regulator, partial [Lachnospiraceae bacterium]|nr:LysR family transcriptional regulator [Lachnospiraceae bacterium]
MEQHLSQYRIFYEVARCGNISRAAKELYISQPAISKAISKLEENLNTKLFIRNSRGVQLTKEGNVLFQHINSAFESINRGERELKRIHDFHIGHLKIGVSNTLCKYVLLPYLKGFVEKYPHVNISIESQATNHTLEMLDARNIDLGLVAEPKNRKGLIFTPVMEISDAFVCTPAYMENLLLREGKTPNIFQAGNIILLDRSNMSRKH